MLRKFFVRYNKTCTVLDDTADSSTCITTHSCPVDVYLNNDDRADHIMEKISKAIRTKDKIPVSHTIDIITVSVIG